MKLKNTYLIFTLLFIPGYIFYMPAINYIYNFNQITYSLSMPENNINNNSTQVTEHRDIEISDEIPLKQVISESWIISFPDITSEKLINDFLSLFFLSRIDWPILVLNRICVLKGHPGLFIITTQIKIVF